MGLVALLTVAAAVGYGLSRRAPAWWAGSAGFEAGAGERLQNSVISQLHLSRATAANLAPGEAWRSEPWRVSVRAEDVNAWIAEELAGWLANRDPPVRWPARVESARLAFGEGRVEVGARVAHGGGGGGGGGGSSVISAVLTPEMRGDGSLWVRAMWVRVGRLPVPASWVMPRLREAVRGTALEGGEGTAFLLRVLEGKEPLARAVVIPLEDGRRVRVMGLEPRPGAVWITARTERGP